MADRDSDATAPTPQDFRQFISGQIKAKILSWWQPADTPLPFYKRLGCSFMGATFGIIYIAVKRLFFGGATQNEEATQKITEILPLADYPVLLAIILIIAGGVVSLGLAIIISSTHKSGNPIRLFFETILLLTVTIYVLDFVSP